MVCGNEKTFQTSRTLRVLCMLGSAEHRPTTISTTAEDLVRKVITIPKSKNGNTRHLPLNSIALAAFQELFARSSGQGRVFVNMQGESLKGYKHRFDPALREAGISFFT